MAIRELIFSIAICLAIVGQAALASLDIGQCSMTQSAPQLGQKSIERWYPLVHHAVQHALVTDNFRFKVVPAGRRSGKTERAKRFIIRECMKFPGAYFVAAPTRDQVKRIYWADLKLLSFSSLFPQSPSESELIIFFPNGSTLHLIGLDQPARIEGTIWMGGIIDEIADTKPNAWEENISPALDTVHPLRPNYRAWCWLVGVPAGLNHYYDMAERAKLDSEPDWKLYTWESADILPPDVIEAAMRRMSKRQFDQEYRAKFETASGRIYEDYGPGNYSSEYHLPTEQLEWFHDFNFSPMSSGVGVLRGNDMYITDEIILTSAVARQSAQEFVDRYASHENKHVNLYGDPAGRAGEKHGHASDYTEIEDVLRKSGWAVTRKVKKAAPAIRDRQNATRAMIESADGTKRLFINREKAPYCHKGLSTMQFKKGSTFLEADGEYQHITTAIGYWVDFLYPSGSRVDVISYGEDFGGELDYDV